MSGSQVTGWLLVLGAVAFGTGAGNPRLLRAWTAQEEVFLTIVARHPRAWLATNLLFIVGTVLTVTGVALLPDVVPAGWPRQLAIAGATAFALAGSLWLVSLVYRLAVQPTVARGFAQTGATDPWVATLDRLSGGLFQAFIAIAFAGLAAIGVATTAGGPIPALMGWGAAAVSVLFIGILVAVGDLPPFAVYLVSLALGIALLSNQ